MTFAHVPVRLCSRKSRPPGQVASLRRSGQGGRAEGGRVEGGRVEGGQVAVGDRDLGPALVLGGEAPVDAALGALGWQGEPAALVRPWIRRGGFPALIEHHDPVTGLRWLDVADVPPTGRAEIAAALPLAGLDDAIRWLGAADPAARLRGVQAADLLDARTLAPRLALLRLDPSPEVAAAAQARLDGWQREDDARARTALAVAALVVAVEPLVRDLGKGEVDGVLPTPEDAARVFAPAVAPGAAEAYDRWWAEQRRRVRPVGDDASRPEIHALPAGMLRRPGEHLRPFPQGFRGVAGALRPERVWVAWRWSASGTTYDGLVHTGDRWCWYPKPYRVLRLLLAALWG
jgi:hypothetical protein